MNEQQMQEYLTRQHETAESAVSAALASHPDAATHPEATTLLELPENFVHAFRQKADAGLPGDAQRCVLSADRTRLHLPNSGPDVTDIAYLALAAVGGGSRVFIGECDRHGHRMHISTEVPTDDPDHAAQLSYNAWAATM